MNGTLRWLPLTSACLAGLTLIAAGADAPKPWSGILTLGIPTLIAIAIGASSQVRVGVAYLLVVGIGGPFLAARFNPGTTSEEDVFLYGFIFIWVAILAIGVMVGHVLHEVHYLWSTRPSHR